jgi:hypothetical protein
MILPLAWAQEHLYQKNFLSLAKKAIIKAFKKVITGAFMKVITEEFMKVLTNAFEMVFTNDCLRFIFEVIETAIRKLIGVALKVVEGLTMFWQEGMIAKVGFFKRELKALIQCST